MTSEVKQRRARSVLGWGTAWEDLRVLSALRLGAFGVGRGGVAALRLPYRRQGLSQNAFPSFC